MIWMNPLSSSTSTFPLTLNLSEGSVTLSFAPQAARELQQAIATVTASLKANALKTASGAPPGRVTPQESMEYRHTGEVFLELFCNPNIYPSPFAAKVLITVRDERIRLTTEADLSRIIDDINQYLEQVGE
jgi:hypothetical protein